MTGRLLRSRPTAGLTEPVVVDLDGVPTELQVRRHPRARRISLRLSADGDSVILVLPRNARLEEGLAVAQAHGAWIRARLDARPPRIAFAEGATIPVNGRPVIITVVPEGPLGRLEETRQGHCEPAQRVWQSSFPSGLPILDRFAAPAMTDFSRSAPDGRIDGGYLRVGGPAATLDQRVRAFLRVEARRIILSRIAAKAHLLPRPPAAVSVRDTRSRWGSCSQTGRVSFCWRLIMAPPPVLDYVVAHELAHLTHRGHGPAFWKAVDALCCDVAEKRAWLRQHGRDLFRYG